MKTTESKTREEKPTLLQISWNGIIRRKSVFQPVIPRGQNSASVLIVI